MLFHHIKNLIIKKLTGDENVTYLTITLPYISFANKMAPSVSKFIFHAKHESGFKTFLSRHDFEKIGVETPQNGVFSNF